MGASRSLAIAFVLATALFAMVAAAEQATEAGMGAVGWIPLVGEEEEFAMESESARRVLATSSYISYAALRRDSVPCSRRGASYYNCRPGAQANPYTRGCSAITRCRTS